MRVQCGAVGVGKRVNIDGVSIGLADWNCRWCFSWDDYVTHDKLEAVLGGDESHRIASIELRAEKRKDRHDADCNASNKDSLSTPFDWSQT